jgi:hypothetical protein
VIVEDAAKKFFDMKKLADQYAEMLATARDELIVAYKNYSTEEEQYATTGEFGDLRVTVTPQSKTTITNKKLLLSRAIKADPDRLEFFKLDESKAKKAAWAKGCLSTDPCGSYRVEVKSKGGA